VLEIRPGDPRSLPLDEAELVVAGGRGVGSRENWQVIDELADALGASSGGSRVALDLGYIPRQKMIGQTGQNIRPRLYIAAGISGSSHHLGGVRAETLISINKDRSSSIMKQASLGVVGDLHKILPLLVEKLRKFKGEKASLQVQKAGNS
jgi:electron transfer flavoprotein alpha subunit